MSKEHVENFLKAVNEDKELAGAFAKCFAPMEQGDLDPKEKETQIITAVIELGKAKGFEMEAGELLELYQGKTGKDGELSDEDLEMVAGGKNVQKTIFAIASWATLGTLCAFGSGRDANISGDISALGDCMKAMVGQ